MQRAVLAKKNKMSKKVSKKRTAIFDNLLARSESLSRTESSEKAPSPSPVELEIHLIRTSGVFDVNFYLESYADLRNTGIDPVTHYFFHGWKEGRRPSYLFDTQWYLNEYPDVAESGMNPLVHYLCYGEKEERFPSPYFHPSFYKTQLPDRIRKTSLLGAYLGGEWRETSPNEFFDGAFYLSKHVDVASSETPPLLHYISQGWRENREINPRFSIVKYRKLLDEQNVDYGEPLSHFLQIGRQNGDVLPSTHFNQGNSSLKTSGNLLQTEIEKNQSPGPFAEDKLIGRVGSKVEFKARLFAFYLPQFYPFEQNNTWWGPGFTEWRNVTRAIPRFEGHQQPHLPRELGFYDLRNVETMRQQVEMATASGVAGFCFYYYWFNGTRLLDKPLDMFLNNKDIDISFSLMWANENWTRRWDGLENDVLMSQDYHEEDDDALVSDLAKYFADPRYERVDGRPLFKIYRPGIIPNFVARLQKWREIFREKHAMNPLILMVLGFGDFDPAVYNVDGAIEFPPHKLAEGLEPINSQLNILDDEFQGHYLRYDDLVASSLSVSAPTYDLIRTLVPAWDNEARKPSRGMGFVEATPEKYEQWLRHLVAYAQAHPFKNKTPYVFVNAWNEWAEGSHLEPDLYNGVAYLNSTYRALTGIKKKQSPSKNILLVGHDAYKHGAQLLTLNIMKTLRQDFGLTPVLLLLEGGPLVERYEELGEVIILDNDRNIADVLEQLLPQFPVRTAICNTVVTGGVVSHLADRGFEVVSLIHELSQLITERNLEPRAQSVAKYADKIIFASNFVKSSFEKITGPLGEKAFIQPQGIYQHVAYEPHRRSELLRKLGLSGKSKIVINMGYGDLRKGFDLYVNLAKQVIGRQPDCHFVWLGNVHGDLKHWLQIDLHAVPLAGHFHILPFDDDVGSYLNGADVYALTSREDPFPSVVLEALACGVPVVGFEGGGGYGEAIGREKFNGAMVPMADVTAMSDAVCHLLKNQNPLEAEMRSANATATYDWRNYVFGLLQALTPDLKKVSVIVPNYNYSQHLSERLGSIFDQDHPIYELIILDDKSTDNSVDVIHGLLSSANRRAEVIVNTANSGSVFRQWEKGASLSTGDFLWIAEADDVATPSFIRDLTTRMTCATKLAFCDSAQVDAMNQKIGDSYEFYFQDLPNNPIKDTFRMAGPEFLMSALAIKNVILNVSSVIFDRTALVDIFNEHGEDIQSYKMAGDWFIYTVLLSKPSSEVVYVHKANNIHRRHAASVTHALAHQRHLDEIKRVQSITAKKIELPKQIVLAAADYLNRVAEQFGLGDSAKLNS